MAEKKSTLAKPKPSSRKLATKSAHLVKPAQRQPAKASASGAPQEAQRQAGLNATSALVNATAIMEPLQKNLIGADATFAGIYAGLEAKLESVKSGDLAVVESMLLAQAMSLQTIYASLARKAAAQDMLKKYQTHLTLALKAQAQSRATLEALIELKHPRNPPTFVKQANYAQGPQQVNNYGAAPVKPTPAAISESAPNELLGVSHERLDVGTPAAPGAGHQKLEAVGAVHRSQDRCRQSPRVSQCLARWTSAADSGVDQDGEHGDPRRQGNLGTPLSN